MKQISVWNMAGENVIVVILNSKQLMQTNLPMHTFKTIDSFSYVNTELM